MSHTSTSNSDAPLPTAPSSPRAKAPRDRIEERVEPPAVVWSWLRWIIPLLLCFAAEAAIRMAMDLRLIEEPVLYGHAHIDRKVDAFENWYLPRNEPGARYLFMGSSMPNTNVDPVRVTATLEAETGQQWTGFNGGFFAGRYADMQFFLDWYYDRWKFDHLVMTFEPWGLRPGYLESLQERLSAPSFERWISNRSALFAMRNQFRLWDEGLDTRTRGKIALDRETTIYGWVRTIGTIPDREASAQAQADQMFNQTLTPWEKFPLEWERLAAVKEWAAERDVTVWWVLSPTVPMLQDKFDEEFRHENWRRLAHQHAAGPGNHIIDLLDLEDTVVLDEHFWDANHMTPLGAAIFSVELGRHWAAMLEGDSPPAGDSGGGD